MNRGRMTLIGLGVVVLLQLAVPAWMVLDRERTLRLGEVYRFRTRPVDPVDAFRGRYVWVSLAPANVTLRAVNPWRYGQKAFAVLTTDPEGFATVERLERKRPDGEPALPVRVRGANVNTGEVGIEWSGLDRFYMNERKAPAAEYAYREHSRTNHPACHVTVRVRGARGVMENLFVEDQPIHDWLRARSP